MWVHRGASLNQLVVVRVPAPSSAFGHTLVVMLGHLSTASQRCQAPYSAGLSWHERGKVTLFLCSLAEIEWLLSQSCVSCHFVHFLVLWLEKASFPPPPTTHQFAFSRLPSSSFKSRKYLAKRKSRQLMTMSLRRFWSLYLSCLLLSTFRSLLMFVLYIMSLFLVVFRRNREKYNYSISPDEEFTHEFFNK